MQWIIQAIKNTFKFTGRARRKEYWLYYLFLSIISGVSGFILGIFEEAGNTGVSLIAGVLFIIFFIFIMISYLSVTARRLHDVGRSAWWILINFVPLIGALLVFIFTVLDSQPGMNKYGENPKSLT